MDPLVLWHKSALVWSHTIREDLLLLVASVQGSHLGSLVLSQIEELLGMTLVLEFLALQLWSVFFITRNGGFGWFNFLASSSSYDIYLLNILSKSVQGLYHLKSL